MREGNHDVAGKGGEEGAEEGREVGEELLSFVGMRRLAEELVQKEL